jgi:hypothetical protein
MKKKVLAHHKKAIIDNLVVKSLLLTDRLVVVLTMYMYKTTTMKHVIYTDVA